MKDFFPTAGLFTLLGVGLTLAALGVYPAIAEGVAAMSENEFRFLQIVVTAIVAFGGFYFGTVYKYHCDLKLARRKEEGEKKLLAIQLLAEIRHSYISWEMLREQMRQFADAKEASPVLPHADVEKFLVFPTMPVFAASVERLGVFGEEATHKTVDFYLTYESVTRSLDPWIDVARNLEARLEERYEQIYGPAERALRDQRALLNESIRAEEAALLEAGSSPDTVNSKKRLAAVREKLSDLYSQSDRLSDDRRRDRARSLASQILTTMNGRDIADEFIMCDEALSDIAGVPSKAKAWVAAFNSPPVEKEGGGAA